MTPETEAKLARVRAFLKERGMSAALFSRPGNFAWLIGGGRSHVSLDGDRGVASLLVTADLALILADSIEMARLREEEGAASFEPREYRWWIGQEVDPTRMISDTPAPGRKVLTESDAATLRNPLLPEEVARYRALGEDVGVVLTHVAFHCRPGLSEHQLAGMLGGACMDFGIEPLVTLVAVDERIARRRHPLPTGARLERSALLVLCVRRGGLHLSASRMVHFGPLPAELERKHAACARVDAAFLHATRPDAALGEVFAAGEAAYAAEGFAGEWKHHHQGGPTGYAPRDVIAVPGSPEPVRLGQAFAWNPTISGTKSEDTFLLTGEGLELLSPTPDLPHLQVEVAGQRYLRPAILQR